MEWSYSPWELGPVLVQQNQSIFVEISLIKRKISARY